MRGQPVNCRALLVADLRRIEEASLVARLRHLLATADEGAAVARQCAATLLDRLGNEIASTRDDLGRVRSVQAALEELAEPRDRLAQFRARCGARLADALDGIDHTVADQRPHLLRAIAWGKQDRGPNAEARIDELLDPIVSAVRQHVDDLHVELEPFHRAEWKVPGPATDRSAQQALHGPHLGWLPPPPEAAPSGDAPARFPPSGASDIGGGLKWLLGRKWRRGEYVSPREVTTELDASWAHLHASLRSALDSYLNGVDAGSIGDQVRADGRWWRLASRLSSQRAAALQDALD